MKCDHQTFKTRDASSYNSVVDKFDLFTERFSQPLAARLISLARLAPEEHVLDVGTGSGIIALQAARQIGMAGKVLGIDLSEGMLVKAQAKALSANLSGCVEFCIMDAEALDLEDQSFDVVISLFALLHFPNPLSALKEMFRVLHPGGRVVVAIGSGPPRPSVDAFIEGFKHIQNIYLKQRGKLLTAPHFLDNLVETYFPNPIEKEETQLAEDKLSRMGNLPALVRQAGFTGIHMAWQGHQFVVETVEEFWDLQRTFSSIARKRLSAAPPEKVEALRATFVEQCRKVQSRGGRLVYPCAAFYVTAARPSA